MADAEEIGSACNAGLARRWPNTEEHESMEPAEEDPHRIEKEDQALINALNNSGKCELRRKTLLRGCLGCGGLFLLIFLLAPVCDEQLSQRTTPQMTIEARAGFEGLEFWIINLGSQPWEAVDLSLNDGILGGGYALSVGRVAAHTTFRTGLFNFAQSDGTRFNLFSTKPQTLTIKARIAGQSTAEILHFK